MTDIFNNIGLGLLSIFFVPLSFIFIFIITLNYLRHD